PLLSFPWDVTVTQCNVVWKSSGKLITRDLLSSSICKKRGYIRHSTASRLAHLLVHVTPIEDLPFLGPRHDPPWYPRSHHRVKTVFELKAIREHTLRLEESAPFIEDLRASTHCFEDF